MGIERWRRRIWTLRRRKWVCRFCCPSPKCFSSWSRYQGRSGEEGEWMKWTLVRRWAWSGSEVGRGRWTSGAQDQQRPSPTIAHLRHDAEPGAELISPPIPSPIPICTATCCDHLCCCCCWVKKLNGAWAFGSAAVAKSEGAVVGPVGFSGRAGIALL